ncbi:hypothetical protein PV04_01020 [Phialophora macrospora]|uniref:Succinate dehydrogenase assembly factor 4, mitochondrial n=1 Tax=Phialophora macrospora TaxID=1851006 RepID=A0A0D2D5I0_9EURO|nr:hypothetical protein PV04_01020 [Phialophora macrospora]
MKTPITFPRALCAAPRAHLFTSSLPRGSRLIAHTRRHLNTSRPLKKDEPSPFSFQGMAAPPRLPKEEQEIFEALQRQSTGAFSTPLPERRAQPRINKSPDSSAAEIADAQTTVSKRVDKISAAAASEGSDETGPSVVKDMYDKVIEAKGKGEELHPNVMRGAEPEFEGDVNPKTGEVGGPKNEPLRWGPTGEWTYNGRATDF